MLPNKLSLSIVPFLNSLKFPGATNFLKKNHMKVCIHASLTGPSIVLNWYYSINSTFLRNKYFLLVFGNSKLHFGPHFYM